MTKIFRCVMCGNHCRVEMYYSDNPPDDCLYSDADIEAEWTDITEER